MRLLWLPWRWVVSRLARARGFTDPTVLLGQLRRFSQPSEVMEPIELLRAGLVFQARGLINTRAIQHNLDWVWPYWIERQFNPRDPSFVPRAFSITHVNLTHRNWTAVGQPGGHALPIVDPRGLVTPLLDGWSLDTWIVPDHGEPLLPSRARYASQHVLPGDELAIETQLKHGTSQLSSIVDVVWNADEPVCRIQVAGETIGPGWLVVALRPANPEGVSFVEEIALNDARTAVRVNRRDVVQFERAPDRVCMSNYRQGDVLQKLSGCDDQTSQTCAIGLATAAAMFRMQQQRATEVVVHVPLRGPEPDALARGAPPARPTWRSALSGLCGIQIPHERMAALFETALRNLVLFAPDEVWPGPYTYKRFWFRDAAFILAALLAVGAADQVGHAIARFPLRQLRSGYYRSQHGEWDSNGEVLWLFERYAALTGRPLPERLLPSAVRGARWIRNKRLPDDLDAAHAGLMPAGFSAEHLGPNDFYYWDNFWSVAGLRSAARLLRSCDARAADGAARDADRLLRAIERSLAATAGRRTGAGLPAAPYRRMDAGAIGSLAVSYPLQLWAGDDARVRATLDHLLRHHMVHGGFFQDMIHSGINPYLTLHLAQALLRAGDSRHWDLTRTVAGLASPTGQWPEAIHPLTGGGCMGDGQHIWAAAEWVLMLRNMFVREEDERLVVGSGLPAEWLRAPAELRCGPTLTPYGPITVSITVQESATVVHWRGAWRGPPPTIEVALPGLPPRTASGGVDSVRIGADPALARVTGAPA